MNIATKILSVAFLSAALTSCLKDKKYDDREYGLKEFDTGKVIELPGDQSLLTSYALAFKNLDTTFNFVAVRLAANEVAAEDINVTLSLASSTTMISEYNTVNHTSLITFPNTLFTFPNGLVVTIPKGSREGYLRIRTNTSNFDPSSTYALGFTIASVDKPGYTISGNFGKRLITIAAKNKYDGNYDYTVKMSGWEAFGIQGAADGFETWPSNSDGTSIGLITTGAGSNKFYDYWGFGDFIQVAFTAGLSGATGFGATAPQFNFDINSDKLISVVNTAAPDARNRQFTIDPSGRNQWVDSTDGKKYIFAKYILSQVGRPNNVIEAIFTYKGSRP